jgi:16S rRNA C1402 N4-methylase RsmH
LAAAKDEFAEKVKALKGRDVIGRHVCNKLRTTASQRATIRFFSKNRSSISRFSRKGFMSDVTAGLGGHTAAIAQRLTSGLGDCVRPGCRVAGNGAPQHGQWAERIRYFHGAFSKWPQALESFGVSKVDGVLADLGVSRYQFT